MCAVGALCMFYNFSVVYVTEWPPIVKTGAHSAYDMFSWYKHLIVNLVVSHHGFWSWNLFLIAPFPDRCLLTFLLNILRRTNISCLLNRETQCVFTSFEVHLLNFNQFCPRHMLSLTLNVV